MWRRDLQLGARIGRPAWWLAGRRNCTPASDPQSPRTGGLCEPYEVLCCPTTMSTIAWGSRELLFVRDESDCVEIVHCLTKRRDSTGRDVDGHHERRTRVAERLEVQP